MSFPDGTAFRVDRGPLTSYQLEPNELYEHAGQDTVTSLKTCALNSEVRIISSPDSSGQDFTFDVNINPKHFVTNDIKVYLTLPFIVTLNENSKVDITRNNFMQECFRNNDAITYSNFSIIQALERITPKLNDTDVVSVNNIPNSFNMVAPYYANASVKEYLHASQPDRYQSFDHYSGQVRTVSYWNPMGDKVSTSVSAVNDANIFTSTQQDGFSPRTPEWSWVDPHPDGLKNGCIAKCSFWFTPPLSIFSTTDSVTSLNGIKRFGLDISLKANAANYIFNCLKVPTEANTAVNAHRFKDIQVDSRLPTSKGRLLLKILTPPQYMQESLIDKTTNLLKPYSMNFPLVNTATWIDLDGVEPATPKEFSRAGITSGSVPSSIYIGVIKKKFGSFEKNSSTPINFGLIQNLTIKVDSQATTFPSVLALDQLAESNGYDELDQVGRLIKGFPIKIDCSKDLSFPGDTVVGAVGTFNMEVTGTFINQGTTTADYKLCVAMVINGRLVFDGDAFSVVHGAVISSSALTETNFLKDHYSNRTRNIKVIGAGWLSDAGNWIKKTAVKGWNNRENIMKILGEANKLRGMVMGGRLPASNVVGSGTQTTTLGAGDVTRSVFK